MSHSLSASKHSGHPKRDTSPPKQMPVLDEKASSMPNLDDCSRPTSAPPKLYSGSLFLYTNDPFGCFTKEHPDIRDEEQYNKFFNYSKTQHTQSNSQKKQAPYSLGDTANLEPKNKHGEIGTIAEAKSDLDISDMLSRQNSSLADGRFSPDRFDPSSSKAFMEVLDEGFGMHDSQEDAQHSTINRISGIDTPSSLTPTTTTSTDHKKNLSGEGRYRGQRKSKGHISPRKSEDSQHYGAGGAMMPQQMGYMQNPYFAAPAQPYMMSPEFHYMMPNGVSRQSMPGYPVQMMNYYQYGMYPQAGPNQAPTNYENNYGKGMNQETSNYNNNAPRKSKNEGKSSNKGESGKSKTQQSNPPNNNANTNANIRKKDKKQTSESTKQKSDKASSNTRLNEPQGADPQDLERLIDSAPKLAKDQAGCRMLQKQLELNDPEVTNRIFEKAIQEFSALMVDPFGNYLCQKLAEACSRDQMERIIKAASTSLINICFDPHGTRAVQKLIELVKEQDLIDMMVEYLSVDVVGLIKDNNGNHVIQKCLTHMSDNNKQFIYDSIMENCVEIATHKHGCCVIQRCLDHASKNQKDELIKVIVNQTLDLVRDQYGNYVVQYVLELKDAEPRTNENIANELIDDVVDLCKQKFSSNVVEKCLHLNLSEFKSNFISKLMEDNVLVELICDQFGNYVLQRLLTQVSDEEMNEILKVITDNAEVIKNDVFGFKIYTKLSKNYNTLSDDRAKSNPPLSPLVSEGSAKNSDKTRAHSKAQSKKSTSSAGNKKHSDNKRNSNKNEKKHQHQHQHHNNPRNQQGNSGHNNNNQGHNMNYPPGYPMNQYGHPMPGPMMYPHPMQPNLNMMPPQNMGTNMMHPDYYLQNPQMYNQYYNYPAPSQGHPGLYYGKNH